MQVIIYSLLPLTLVVLIGAMLLKSGFYDDGVRRSLDLIVYWLCLPALIVHSLLRAPSDGLNEAGAMTLALTFATLGGTVIAVAIAVLFRIHRTQAGVFAQASMRGNLAYVGLPVIALAIDGDSSTMAKAALVLAPLMLLFNVVSVFLLVGALRYGQAETKWSPTLRKLGRSLATNPLLIASALGLLLWALKFSPGTAAMETLELLAKPATTLALLSLGGAIVIHPIRRRMTLALTGTAIKCGIVPALALLGCVVLDITGSDRQIVLIFAATPTAAASDVMATQLGGDEPLAASGIVVSTLCSAASLAAALSWGG